MIDYESNQSYTIHDQNLLKLETRDDVSELDDYLTIYLEALNEMCETLEIDSEKIVVVNDNDVSCEVVVEKLAEILEQKDLSSYVLKMLSIDDEKHFNKRKKYEFVIVV